jgi:hypothetical protein
LLPSSGTPKSRRAIQTTCVTDASLGAREQGRHGFSTTLKKFPGLGTRASRPRRPLKNLDFFLPFPAAVDGTLPAP